MGTLSPEIGHFSHIKHMISKSWFGPTTNRRKISLTCRRTLALPKVIIIQKLNEAVRGWVGYFYYGNCSRNMATTKRFLEERVRIYLRRKQAKKNRGYRQYPNQYLYANLHLYKIPTTAPWTQTAKASGRR